MWTIVGLGNPGLRYKWNRHNIGFHVIDLLAKDYKIRLKKDKLIPAYIGRGNIIGSDVILVKPTTYMNRSGSALKGLQEFYGISHKNILVVSDDIDLPWGRLRIRQSGGSGGHRGLESIITELTTTSFPRIRIGIGRPLGDGVVEHVLGNFSKEEKRTLKDYCTKAVEAVYTTLDCGIENAMNKFNSADKIRA